MSWMKSDRSPLESRRRFSDEFKVDAMVSVLDGSLDFTADTDGAPIHETARLSTLADSASVVSRFRAAEYAAFIGGSGTSVGVLSESGCEQAHHESAGDPPAPSVDAAGCVEVEALGG